MNNVKNYRPTYALDQTFSIKELIFFILSFSTIVLLTFTLYLQNQQIHELVNNLNNLQIQISSVKDSFTVLENEKNVEILSLKESIKFLSTMSDVLDPEVIRAQTERRELFIRTSLILLGSVTFLCLGYLALNGLSTSTETHYKEYNGTFWKVDVTKSGADMQISVKTPGAGEFGDAMKLLDDFINKSHENLNNINSVLTSNNLGDLTLFTNNQTPQDSLLTLTNVNDLVSFSANQTQQDLLLSPGVIDAITSNSMSVTIDIINMLPNT